MSSEEPVEVGRQYESFLPPSYSPYKSFREMAHILLASANLTFKVFTGCGCNQHHTLHAFILRKTTVLSFSGVLPLSLFMV